MSDGFTITTRPDDANKNNKHAATGASAAGIRAISTQFMAFYFRAPIKAFFRTRVEYDLDDSKLFPNTRVLIEFSYMAIARAVNPQVQATRGWSWNTSSMGLLVHAVRHYGWKFIPDQVLPPMIANVTVGAVLYTSYLQFLSAFHEPSSRSSKRVYPPPPVSATFTAGLAAGTLQSIVAAPLDAIQVRFNTRELLEKQYQSIWQYSGEKLRAIGLRGVLSGWSISLAKDSLGAGLFFATFESIKSQVFYKFVTTYYGIFRPIFTDHQMHMGPEGQRTRPVIRPHYMMEPTAILLAGVTASVAQQIVQHPLTLIQNIHIGRLEALDYANKLEHPSRGKMLRLYYRAYQTTYEQCVQQAKRVGSWRAWLYKDLLISTLRQLPSTSAGLIVFEVVRRKYATDADVIIINKDGYDILLA